MLLCYSIVFCDEFSSVKVLFTKQNEDEYFFKIGYKIFILLLNGENNFKTDK